MSGVKLFDGLVDNIIRVECEDEDEKRFILTFIKYMGTSVIPKRQILLNLANPDSNILKKEYGW